MPKAAMAEVKCGVIITSIPLIGCCRCIKSGSMATGNSANEKTSEKRAISLSCFTPKTWYSEESTKAPATRPVMKGYMTIWMVQ